MVSRGENTHAQCLEQRRKRTRACTNPRSPPKAPGEAPITAAVLCMNALYMASSSWLGREHQSSRFFSNGVTLPLYLGAHNRRDGQASRRECRHHMKPTLARRPTSRPQLAEPP